MGSFSIWHWLIVLAIVILLFGRGKIPELMGDFAKGIKNFKKGMADDEPAEAKQPEPKALDGKPAVDANATSSKAETTKTS
ncbi:MAG TPA: twin-arginine translocase TatA/TatE family subunit [Hyphomicrobiaceae bacterium]|nr:twin-arginine translocase TatA/TatE family subunit [Hyphomicrobiaceae bacterium]